MENEVFPKLKQQASLLNNLTAVDGESTADKPS